MKKKKAFIVEWGVFPLDVLVCLGMTNEEIHKEVAKYHKMDDEVKEAVSIVGTGKTAMLRHGGIVLSLRHYPKPGDGVLVHEIFHAVYLFLQKIGITISDDCDELPAYMMQYLSNKIHEKL